MVEEVICFRESTQRFVRAINGGVRLWSKDEESKFDEVEKGEVGPFRSYLVAKQERLLLGMRRG